MPGKHHADEMSGVGIARLPITMCSTSDVAPLTQSKGSRDGVVAEQDRDCFDPSPPTQDPFAAPSLQTTTLNPLVPKPCMRARTWV